MQGSPDKKLPRHVTRFLQDFDKIIEGSQSRQEIAKMCYKFLARLWQD